MSDHITTGKATNSFGSREHFARLKQMLREGRFGPGPKLRRYSPAAAEPFELSWEKMAALGSLGRSPSTPFRRVE